MRLRRLDERGYAHGRRHKRLVAPVRHGPLKHGSADGAHDPACHHRASVKAFYTHHHLTVTTTRMRYGAGGWMGLGGMWGGWGW
jgi:hypothetical protein